MNLDLPIPPELMILQDIGDHPYAVCHRDNAKQVADQDIEDLLLILDPTHTLSITREGDPDPESLYPSGWVMLLDDESTVNKAIQELVHIIEH